MFSQFARITATWYHITSTVFTNLRAETKFTVKLVVFNEGCKLPKFYFMLSVVALLFKPIDLS